MSTQQVPERVTGTDTRLRAYHDHVLAKVDKVAPRTEAGLYLPESAQRQQGWATILHVGENVTGLKPGDRIVWKDSAAFVGGQVVTKESAVYVDQPNGIIAVHYRQIITYLPSECQDVRHDEPSEFVGNLVPLFTPENGHVG